MSESEYHSESESELELEELYEKQINEIKYLLYDESNNVVLCLLKSLFEKLKTDTKCVPPFSFFTNEMEDYCEDNYKVDNKKTEVIKLLLKYITFDVYYIEIASNYTSSLTCRRKRDDDYIEHDEIAEQVLNILVNHSLQLSREDKLTSEECNSIIYCLLRNKKFDQCLKCLEHLNYDLHDKNLFNELWNNGDKNCIKHLTLNYFDLKDEFKEFDDVLN